MKTIRIISLLLALSMLFMLCSCGARDIPSETLSQSGGSETAGQTNGKTDENDYDKTEKLTEDFVTNLAGEKPTDEFVAAYNGFAAELFAKTRNSGQSSLVSPLSVIYALAMTFTGAEGETLSQFLRAFDKDGKLDMDKIGASLAGLASGLYKSDSAYTNLANSIWVKNRPDLKLKDDFLDKNSRYYHRSGRRFRPV